MELQQGRVRRELLKQNDDSFLFFQPGVRVFVCLIERESETTTLTTMNNLIVKKTSKRMIILLKHVCSCLLAYW